MRLIDADRLNEVLNINFGHTGGADVLRQLIDIQPTVQAVPIEVLQEIRREIEKPLHDERCFDTADAKAQYIALNWVCELIDKHIKEIEGEDIGDYPDEIPNQFDNLTGSMNL